MNRFIRKYCFGANPLQALWDWKTIEQLYCCMGLNWDSRNHVPLIRVILLLILDTVRHVNLRAGAVSWEAMKLSWDLHSAKVTTILVTPILTVVPTNNHQVFIGKVVSHVYLPSQRRCPGIHFSFSLLKSFIVRIWFLFSFLHWNSDDLHTVGSNIVLWRPGQALHPVLK